MLMAVTVSRQSRVISVESSGGSKRRHETEIKQTSKRPAYDMRTPERYLHCQKADRRALALYVSG